MWVLGLKSGWPSGRAVSARNHGAILSFAVLGLERSSHTRKARALPPSHSPVLFSENRMLTLGTAEPMTVSVSNSVVEHHIPRF